jgi:O-antigen/teichoic acid export membrane protein
LEGGDDHNVGQRFVRGAAWLIVSKLAERGLGLVSTLILARLLLPADFGLVAMAAPVVALVELLGALGMDAALIQRKNLERTHLDTVFTLNVIVSAAMAVSMWVAAPFAAVYFHEPRLEAVINWLALGNLVQGFGNPAFILFRKEIDMRPGVIVLIARKLSSLVVAAVAAIIIGNYWALVWGTLVSRFVGVGLSYAMAPYRPRLSLSARAEVLGFSAWVWVTQMLWFLQLRGNDLIIGRLLGATPLAYFNLGVDLAATATGEAVTAVSRAAFPTLAKLSNEAQRLRMGLRHILSGVAFFALPAALGIAATQELLVLVLLGNRWMPVSEILASLAISSAVLGIMGQVANVYMALGHPRAGAVVSAIAVPVLLACSIILMPIHGLASVNIAFPAMAATVSVGHYIMLRRMLPAFRTSDWIAAFWRPLAAAGAMFYTVRAAIKWIGPVHGSVEGIQPLLGVVLLGTLFYAITLAALWRLSGSPAGPEAMIWAKLRHARSSAVSLVRKLRLPS